MVNNTKIYLSKIQIFDNTTNQLVITFNFDNWFNNQVEMNKFISERTKFYSKQGIDIYAKYKTYIFGKDVFFHLLYFSN